MSLSGESSASSISSSSSAKLRKRPVAVEDSGSMHETASPSPQQPPEEESVTASSGIDASPSSSWTVRNQWIVYAIASGGCAAFNGVFAKLTTNDLTTHIARGISGVLGLTASQGIEVAVRCVFFGLNLAFNGVMWTLFTRALAKGHSTTQVSIMNTSTNFMITALLGLVIFAESLPPLWWLGAAMLVAGNVIIGRKSEDAPSSSKGDEITDDSRSRLLDGTASDSANNSADTVRQGYGSVVQNDRDQSGRNGVEETTTAQS